MRAILFVFDGLRPDLVSPETTPHLAALAAAGTRFAGARSVFPSETRVAVSSLVTGCRPGAHGLVANQFLAPSAVAGRMLRTKDPEDLAALAHAAGGMLGRPSLGERLAAAGRALAVVSTGSPGAATLMHHRAVELGGFLWNPALPADPALADRFGPPPPAALPNVARIAQAARIFVGHVLTRLRPAVALFWAAEPDASFHYHGLRSPEALAGLAAADAALGEVLAWRAAQPDAAEIPLLALSDHGQVTGQPLVPVAARLREAGFAAGEALAPGTDIAVAAGGAPGLWLADAALAPRIAEWWAAQPFAGALLARDPALLPGALPLALLGAAHPRSPDLFLAFGGEAGPDRFGMPGTTPYDAPDVPEGGGIHGGLHPGELATVLVAEGGPFRRGAVVDAACDLTDVVPTLLHLLGLPSGGVEGRALREGLQDGPEPVADHTEVLEAGRGWTLRCDRQQGRLYPRGLLRG